MQSVAIEQNQTRWYFLQRHIKLKARRLEGKELFFLVFFVEVMANL